MSEQAPEVLFDRWRRSGDVRALGEAFDRTAPELLRLARRLVRERADAEDLVQATWLAAIEAGARYERGRPLGAWLAGILVRQAGLARRHGSRAQARGDLDPAHAPDPAAPLESRELAEALARSLERLTPAEREVLVPLLLDEKRAVEIARELALRPEAVQMRASRGLAKLRRFLSPGLGLGVAALLDRQALARMRPDLLQRAAAAPGAASIALPLAAGGALALSKLALALLGACAIAAAWLVTRPAPGTAPVSQHSFSGLELAPSADGVVEPLPSASERSALAPVPAAARAPARRDEPARWVLRGKIEGPSAAELSETQIRILGARELMSWSLKSKPDVRVDARGEFALDFSELFTESYPKPPETLLVKVDHPRFVHETVAIPVVEGHLQRAPDGQAEWEIRRTLSLRLAAVITGRVLAPAGREQEECTVMAGVLEAGAPKLIWNEELASYQFESRDVVSCASGASFRLRLPVSGSFALCAVSPSSAPSTVFVETALASERSVGTIVLDAGAPVCGSVVRAGASRGAFQVRARRATASEACTGTWETQCCWEGGRFRRVEGRSASESDGSFCIHGFEAGDVLELALDDCGDDVDQQLPGIDDAATARATAPASALLLTPRCARIRIEFSGLDPEVQSVPYRAYEMDGERVVGTLYSSSRNAESLTLVAGPGWKAPMELEPAGYRRERLELVFPEAGAQTDLRVRFEPQELASVRILLRDPASAPIAHAWIGCKELDPASGEVDSAHPRATSQETTQSERGEFAFSGLYPGRYRFQVRPGAVEEDREGFYILEELVLDLVPGAAIERELRPVLGGRLTLRVRTATPAGADAESTVVARLSLQGPQGPIPDVELRKSVENGRLIVRGGVYPGLNSLQEPLPPGEYALVIEPLHGKPLQVRAQITPGVETELALDLEGP